MDIAIYARTRVKRSAARQDGSVYRRLTNARDGVEMRVDCMQALPTPPGKFLRKNLV